MINDTMINVITPTCLEKGRVMMNPIKLSALWGFVRNLKKNISSEKRLQIVFLG